LWILAVADENEYLESFASLLAAVAVRAPVDVLNELLVSSDLFLIGDLETDTSVCNSFVLSLLFSSRLALRSNFVDCKSMKSFSLST
jgi:hypothetical protein